MRMASDAKPAARESAPLKGQSCRNRLDKLGL